MSSLDDLRATALARVASFDAELATLRADRADATADDEHDPEGSTLSSDWSRLTGLRADALAQLSEIDTALARRADGTYGICVSCGKVIPAERLAVRPAATRCVACASIG